MHKAKLAALLLGAAAVFAIMVPGVASAHHRAWTGIKISHVPGTGPHDGAVAARPYISGVLQSKNEGCETGREVIVKRARKHAKNKIIGTDYSSLRGAWSVDVNYASVLFVKVNPTAYCSGAKLKLTPVS